MALNKSKGNMYDWVTHTFNPIKGECPHDCVYCYMKIFKNIGPLRFDPNSLKTDLGNGNTIFVGSSTDMFSNRVASEYIKQVLETCNKYPENTYLFQSKNPARFMSFIYDFPPKTILGTTIESDIDHQVSKAPPVSERVEWMIVMAHYKFKTMISVEPILDFNLDKMVRIIKTINPQFVSIGADSKNHLLKEPSKEKLDALISELGKLTEIKIKVNMKRLEESDVH